MGDRATSENWITQKLCICDTIFLSCFSTQKCVTWVLSHENKSSSNSAELPTILSI